MRTVLAIDTSSSEMAKIAMVRGEQVLIEEEHTSGKSHNARIFEPLRTALAVAVPDVLVVGTGPGSYTGVRIGISAAMGICSVFGIPMLGIPSILALAGTELEEAAEGSRGLLVIGDARRGQIWVALVQNGQLEDFPVPMAPEKVRSRIKAREESLVVSSDPNMLSFGNTEGMVPAHPSAALLAKRAARLSETELARLKGQPVVPIYLAPPFVTQPQKAEK